MKHVSVLTFLVMLAFAGNSIIVRLALSTNSIGSMSFSMIRLLSGALVLALMAKPALAVRSGSWGAASYLLMYVVFFSYAYLSLDAGTGALILFATVQIVMIGAGVRQGERLSAMQCLGALTAGCGLLILLRPGSSGSPNLIGVLMMAFSGVGWALYSLRGRFTESPALATAGNFLRASLLIVAIGTPLLFFIPENNPDTPGVAWAIVSGAITSGLGYTLWYKVLRHLSATRASIAQLSVPAIAALGGVLFLSEALTLRLLGTISLILGGVALATIRPTTQLAERNTQTED